MNRLQPFGRMLRRLAPFVGRRRFLWTAASSFHESLESAASQCAERIRSSIAAAKESPPLPTSLSSKEEARDSCFVLVSQSYPAAEIDRLTSTLREHLADSAGNSGVCFSGAVVDQVVIAGETSGDPCLGNGLTVLYHRPSNTLDDPQLRSYPFYIGDQHGRQRLREVAVGRWHNKVTDRFRQQSDSPATTRWVAGVSGVTQAMSHMVLPSELSAPAVSPALVDLVLFAADRDSRQALDLLDAQFPQATKIGIVGSRTPFLNGREYTLLASNNSSSSCVHDSGMVGLAFARTKEEYTACRTPKKGPEVLHSSLVPISDALRIVRCKGNVVLELENGDAARSLIASVRRQRMEFPEKAGEKDTRLFAKITAPSCVSDGAATNTLESAAAAAVFEVTGGDPAKGGLALDTLRDLSPGQFIQFMVKGNNDSQRVLDISDASDPSSALLVMFGAADFYGDAARSRELQLRNASAAVFGGVTEGGFVYGGPSVPSAATASSGHGNSSVLSGSVECPVPGSVAILGLK
ncbi:hypothetical protein H4S06_001598 [Coemansia sp. BCRC 34490]|nr:hypothetical protein H4S06_001598 [Coemansia sp. BCRC 34490]